MGVVFFRIQAQGFGNIVEQSPGFHQRQVQVLSTLIQLAGYQQSHIGNQLAVPQDMG